ncbi:transporter substrate-binding domain-containing protein [Microvirga brassicacearum]|uniref:Transporter substrate-binding domain-containing protein n=1 Tax=Microvirga brassicacearum TaxID=2580413 RepID=A0A5N3PI90_9HYPH|nr:transporter substrate-binding domain-containing protein [Microvirga brassicacearum]KAB0269456.1 transporter substrate-binding domain-containing protein [Microvirga brassicacearum]
MVFSRSSRILILIVLLSGCDFPRDAAGSLDRIRSTGVVRIGFSQREPWVIKASGEVGGIEPRLIRAWAAKLGARIEWVEGAETVLIDALHHRQLDVAIGGFVDDSPWEKHVGMSQPFAHAAVVIAKPRDGNGQSPTQNAAGQIVGYPGTRPDFAGLVADAGAIPILAQGQRPGAVAAYDFELDRTGLQSAGTILSRERHVMTVAPGENALLLSLDRFLASAADQALVGGSGL